MTKAILLGSKAGAVVALSHMLKLKWDVVKVVIAPDHNRPWLPAPSLEDYARSQGVPVTSSQDDLEGHPVDVVISYMYRKRVLPKTLELARTAALNFHPAPLPYFGGWAFYNVAILEDSKLYGCTCHHMDANFDTGDLVQVRVFPIDASNETALSLEKRTQREMAAQFRDICAAIENGSPLARTPQDPDKIRYMTKSQFERLRIMPNTADAATIDRFARAFWHPPFQCATLELDGGRFVEIVPRVVVEGLAPLLHKDALTDLDFECETSLHDVP